MLFVGRLYEENLPFPLSFFLLLLQQVGIYVKCKGKTIEGSKRIEESIWRVSKSALDVKTKLFHIPLLR